MHALIKYFASNLRKRDSIMLMRAQARTHYAHPHIKHGTACVEFSHARGKAVHAQIESAYDILVIKLRMLLL